MRINTNSNANSAWTSYTNNQDKLKKSMARLSTGVIQSTDDPAGIGISERMRAQAKGTEMARFNTDNAISLVQTADSWLQKTNDMLSRMKSLSVEAAGIMSSTDKENLQVEFEAMQDEITRITSKDTAAGKFNGLYLFRGGNGTTGANDNVKTTGGSPAKAASSQQPVVNSSGSSTVIAMAGGGYVVSNAKIDGTNKGVQLYDDDGNKVGGANLSVANLTNITALKTGGFITEGSTAGTLQKYDRYGDKVGGEIELGTITDLVDGTTEITALEDGNVIVNDGTTVSIVNFDAKLSADKVVDVATTTGGAKVAAFNTGEFIVYDNAASDTIKKYDAAGEEIQSFTAIDPSDSFGTSFSDVDQLVTLKDGGFLAVDKDNGEIQKFNANGSAVGDLITFDSNASVGDVTALNDGGFIVANTVETNGSGSNNALMLTRFSEDGSKFEEIQANNGRAIGNVSTVDVAVLANGDFVVEFDQVKGDGTGTGDSDTASYATKFEMDSGINLQIGADLNQTLTLDMPDLQVTNHKIIGSYTKVDYDEDNNVTGETTKDVRWSEIIDKNKLNVTSDDVIGKLDVAINFVSKSRASIAAQQNRLQNTKEGLLSYQDNLTAAESTIRDVDMARESTNFSKTQIVTNASNAILAQANGLPNSVLQLLG